MSLDESSPTMSDRHFVHHEDEIQLAKLLKESKPFLEKYGTTIIYGVAAIMAVAALVVYLKRQPAPTAEVSGDLLLATTAEDYQAVADGFSDSPIGILARLRQADRELEDAVSNMFTNREAAKDRLETAEKAYRQLEDRKDVNDSVRERVLVGLARVAECHCDGTDDSMNTAIAAWRSVLTAFPDSKTFKSIAEARIKRLESRDSREFYAWFSTQNPKPGDDLLMPQDGGPGPIPATPFNAFPDLGLSGPGQATPNAGALATPSDGDATKEKSEEEKQPDDQPAADAPSDSPATPDPASEAPANEAPAGEKSANDTPVDPPASDEPASDTSVPEKSGE